MNGGIERSECNGPGEQLILWCGEPPGKAKQRFHLRYVFKNENLLLDREGRENILVEKITWPKTQKLESALFARELYVLR